MNDISEISGMVGAGRRPEVSGLCEGLYGSGYKAGKQEATRRALMALGTHLGFVGADGGPDDVITPETEYGDLYTLSRKYFDGGNSKFSAALNRVWLQGKAAGVRNAKAAMCRIVETGQP